MTRSPGKRLFIDTNLLVLLLVGSLAPEQVERFRRTRAYSRDDFLLLARFVNGFQKFLTTPNVMTEVSNLLGHLEEPLRQRALMALGAFAKGVMEQYLATSELAAGSHHPSLGLADASIIASADASVTVLTDDLDLYLRLSAAGLLAINFNHVRAGSWT